MNNNYKYYMLSLAVLLFTFTSCDECEDPIIPQTEGYNIALYGAAPTFEPATPEMLIQKVLIEDFTGHHCGNCPEAALVAEELKAQHPNEVSILAIHAGDFTATDEEFPTDWTSGIGNEMWNNISSQFNPGGRINRGPVSDQLQFLGAWTDLTEDLLNEDPKIVMQLETSLEEGDGILNIHVFTELVENYTGNIKMAAYITESELEGPQLDYNSDPEVVEEYEFEFVLRDDINGIAGVSVGSNVSDGFTIQHDYSYEYENVIIENCTVVAIAYDSDSGVIINVVEQEIN